MLRSDKMTCLAQAGYDVASGLWPIVSPRTFQAVTGRKTDVWLVQTIGALIGVVGTTLAVAAKDGRQDTATVRTLALGSALSLAAVDVCFVARRHIPPIYLADGGIELGLVAGWLAGAKKRVGG
jgi:hypothetical protein